MVKTLQVSSNFTKAELLTMLKAANSSAQKNKIIKNLKKFNPKPNNALDNEGQRSKMSLKLTDELFYFV